MTNELLSIRHKREGLARPCSAWDVFLVTGGLQCGNCLAHNVPEPVGGCESMTGDVPPKPCPLKAEPGRSKCWIHELQAVRP